jgi:hypothetical protein
MPDQLLRLHMLREHLAVERLARHTSSGISAAGSGQLAGGGAHDGSPTVMDGRPPSVSHFRFTGGIRKRGHPRAH